MVNIQELQIILFNKIKESLPPEALLANEIADSLNISPDSAYRRIRGEKKLILDEVFTLSNKYNISIDDLFKTVTKGDTFLSKVFEAKITGFGEYYNNLCNNLCSLMKLRDIEMFYSAKDIPLFQHFNVPETAAFKVFFWSRTVLNLPGYADKKYHFGEFDKSILETGKRALQVYNKIPSSEIWNEETINSTLRQIEYYVASGVIEDKNEAYRTCDAFDELFAHICRQAEQGCKFFPGQAPAFHDNYRLYNNEVLLGDNSILVTSSDLRTTFLPFNIFSYMVSSDAAFCDEVENYFRNTMKKSGLISKDSEKERNRFFNLMHQKVVGTKEKIKYI